MKDDLVIIYILIQQKGYATNIYIPECLNVFAPTITKMMRRLHEIVYLNMKNIE
jgi:Mn-dependent DtxR family transcriptional regulator